MDLIIGLNDVRRKLEQTACDDHNVILDPGVYSVRFLTVDGKPTEPDNALLGRCLHPLHPRPQWRPLRQGRRTLHLSLSGL